MSGTQSGSHTRSQKGVGLLVADVPDGTRVDEVTNRTRHAGSVGRFDQAGLQEGTTSQP